MSSEEFVWSCCRTNCGSPVATTPGVVTARKNGLRPAVGSVSRVLLSRVLPSDAFEVSSGVAPSTVIASCRLPTSSEKSSVRNCWVPMWMPLFSMLLKPCIKTLRL